MATKKTSAEETVETVEAEGTIAAQAASQAEKAVGEAAESAAAPAAKKAEPKPKAAAKPESGKAEPKPKAADKPAKAAPAVKAEKTADKPEKPAAKAEKPAGKAAPAVKPAKIARLRQKYQEEVAPALRTQFGYTNAMQIPKLEKIILNMGLGSEKDNPKGIEAAVRDLSVIAGQKAVVTKAKKSVANFKVRAGMNIGAKVTLRGERMYFFADKLMNIVLPRVRDFRGVSDKAFDGRGNFAMGLKEQLIFPEINYDDVDKVRGMNVVFVTSAGTDEEAKALLRLLGMPFVPGA